MEALLRIRDLRIRLGARDLVDIPSLDVAPGERLGIVGESGSGKTLSVLSVVSLLPEQMSATGSISFLGRELLGRTETELRDVRGREIGMVFQDPARALNPTMRIGKQLAEPLRLHTEMSREQRRSRTLELLDQVRLPQAEKLLTRYPHELSGGQQQRVMVAMAVACRPKLLIADEPTTALDVTVQEGVLALLQQLTVENDMAMLFVSHNLGVVQSVCDRILVMRRGRQVELGETRQVISAPRQDYTKALIAANPRLPGAPAAADEREVP